MAQVDNAVLLDKVINCQNRDIYVCKAYDCAHANSLDQNEHFKQCIDFIKQLDEVAWNTKLCQEEGKMLNVSWREYHILCNEIIPKILGETIKELCIKPVFAEATMYGDEFSKFCPFSKGDFVMYTAKPIQIEEPYIEFEGKKYKIRDKDRINEDYIKIEETPFYTIDGIVLEI